MRWFHQPATRVMVSTPTLENELVDRGFDKLARWGRGVDLQLFRPRGKDFLSDVRPILMYVGRVAVEKNIEQFLRLDTPGTKYVVGDGPQIKQLKRKYPHVRFVGDQQGEDLAQYYSAADVFVFPSRTDTFGLVLLEALASGVPVAAYPVPGPLDVVGNSGVGVLDEDLGAAVRKALQISPDQCRRYAQRFSWHSVTQQFLGNLEPIRETSRRAAA
jgi:glycosyltransferase involved in cell wall biosynthesis